jgi:segregation and condensation protein A
MALVRRLQVYEQFKQAALDLDALPRYERDVFQVQLEMDGGLEEEIVHPEVNLSSLSAAMSMILLRQTHLVQHQIVREVLCVRERMGSILQRLHVGEFTHFSHFFTLQEGRRGLIVTLLAILELSKQSLLTLIQLSAFAPLHVKAVPHE